MQPRYRDKLIGIAEFEALRPGLRARGLTLAHCHGCFDIVHPGHIRHLRFAATQGDRLLVSVTPDRFVDKGPGRPMFNERLRAENLAALEFVDWVVINDAPVACGLLERVRPDCYIKGAEYRQSGDERFEREREVVERFGGRVVFSPADVVHSSSAIIESLRTIGEGYEQGGVLEVLASEHDLSAGSVARCLERARGARVLVLGESIIDQYAHCRQPEVAQEHPMLSLVPDREECFEGGAAVIAGHLGAMGLEVTLCTPLGRDPESRSFVDRVERAGVRVDPIECDEPLPRKLRYLVNGEKVMKIDSNTRYDLDDGCADDLIRRVEDAGGYDALFVVDFGLGLFANGLASRFIAGVRPSIGMILGDVSGRRAKLSEMRGVDVLCPCEIELRQSLNDEDTPLPQLVREAMQTTGASTICVTRAARGMTIFDRELGARSLPALCVNPVDVLGCGDALLTAMGGALLGGADRVQAGYIGSLAAAIEGETLGNAIISSDQIVARALRLGASFLSTPEACVPVLKEPLTASRGMTGTTR